MLVGWGMLWNCLHRPVTVSLEVFKYDAFRHQPISFVAGLHLHRNSTKPTFQQHSLSYRYRSFHYCKCSCKYEEVLQLNPWDALCQRQCHSQPNHGWPTKNSRYLQCFGMQRSTSMTKTLIQHVPRQNSPCININCKRREDVEDFTYFGSILPKTQRVNEMWRTRLEWHISSSPDWCLFFNHPLKIRTKNLVFRAIFLSTQVRLAHCITVTSGTC